MNGPSTGDEPSERMHTILVVEDEILIRMSVSRYLRECGFRVLEAASAAEALVVLEAKEIDIDIVFSDIEMPGTMDGFLLSQWVRKHRPDIDVMLVGTATHAVEKAGELCRSIPHIEKPYEHHIVLDRIKRLMAARHAARTPDDG